MPKLQQRRNENQGAEATVAYRSRHKDIRWTLRQNLANAVAKLEGPLDLPDERGLLLGAYFTQEYSLESAALINPSMVIHPDQSGLPPGATRFVMSLRACGEGHMRQYSIGALLLDLEDPSRVIGELTRPLLRPNADERDGYVPNVVYSCGVMRNDDHLVIPFAVSDAHTTFATVSLPALLAELRRHAP